MIHEDIEPNQVAKDKSKWVLELLELNGVVPSRVVNDCEGGIALYFFNKDKINKYISITCFNEGETVFMSTDRNTDKVECFEVAITINMNNWRKVIDNIKELYSDPWMDEPFTNDELAVINEDTATQEWILDAEESKVFVDLLFNPPEPSENLKRILKRVR